MKNIQIRFLILFICALPFTGFSQSRAFRDFIIAASSKTNPTIIADNFKEVGGASRFVSENWSGGYVLPKKGELISDGYKFNYDYQDKNLYLKSTESKEIISVSMLSVKMFGVVNDQGDTIHFRKNWYLDNTYHTFYEVVAGTDSSDVAIFKLKNVEYKEPNKNDYLRNFSGDYKGTYKPLEEYYLHQKPKGYKKLSSLNKKEMYAFFEDYKDKVLAAFKKKKELTDKEAKDFVNSILITQ